MAGRVKVAGRGEELVIRTKPLVKIPAWMVVVGLLARGLFRLVRFLVRHPRFTASAAFVSWLLMSFDLDTLGVVALVLVVLVLVGLASWRGWHRSSFSRWVGLPVLAVWRKLRLYRRGWHSTMRMCGLGVKVEDGTAVPILVKVVCTEATDRLVVRILRGQTPEDFRKKASEIGYAFGAREAKIYEQRPDAMPIRVTSRKWLVPLVWLLRKVDARRWADRPGVVHIVIARKDPLTAIVRPFAMSDVVDFAALPVAITSTLDVFRLRLLANHWLVAGASRRGKGSVIWSLIRALAPAVKSGLAQLWVIDPKGGMELAFGKPMFTHFAYKTFEHMADLLERAVTEMQARQERLAGVVRLHTPAVGDPLIVIIIDEIAALTTYCPDPEIRKRVESALGLLLSQGAGLGVLVVGALQDPRKETLPMRDLFLSRVLLGVLDPAHVNMVLGDGARDRGALADKLDADRAKGVGYVMIDGTPEPAKVRFTYLDDGEIRRMAAAYPAPTPAVSDEVSATIPAQSNGRSATDELLPASLRATLSGRANGVTGGGRS